MDCSSPSLTSISPSQVLCTRWWVDNNLLLDSIAHSSSLSTLCRLVPFCFTEMWESTSAILIAAAFHVHHWKNMTKNFLASVSSPSACASRVNLDILHNFLFILLSCATSECVIAGHPLVRVADSCKHEEAACSRWRLLWSSNSLLRNNWQSTVNSRSKCLVDNRN